ncbi:signal recognition particle protein [soil metagenome]
MFGQLQDNLEATFKRLRGLGKISESNVTDAMREVRLALLEADVDFAVAKDFIKRVREQALGAEVLKSVTPGQQIVKIFHDELEETLGGEQVGLNLDSPARVLMVGLNGAGKTTTSAKLALHLKKQGRRPLLFALDLYRPAAVEQLVTLGREIDVPVFTPEPGQTDVLKTAANALEWAKSQDGTVQIFDTAGRQEIDERLVQELKELRDFLDPREVLLVADAATGQQAVSVAQHFDDAVGVTGIVLTKLDGDARGGAALSMRQVTGQPIKFAGTGEKLEALEAFVPGRMADRILGMGDVVGLVEKAVEAIDEEEAQKLAKRFGSSDFDLNDFLAQMKMIKKLGPLEGLMGMIPGMGKMMKGGMPADTDKRPKHTEAIILSMTKKERTRPEILKGRRRARVARGSGTTVTEVNQLLRQFSQMRKMMKNKGAMKKMMGQMMGGGGGGGGFPGLPKM